MNNKATKRNFSRPLSCIFGGMSVASSFAISSAIKHSNMLRLQHTLPLALGIGLLCGIIYFFILSKSLPKLDRKNHSELWNGVAWFNWSTLILWMKILPIPENYIEFSIGFILSAGCARLAGSVYTVFGSALSNRKRFANIFILLTVTIMLVISVVKSSLALSLGLVGALSIIRFRTAVKEPEELAFLFFTIAIGLGFGAGKITITLIAFWAICIGFIFFKKLDKKSNMNEAYLVSVYSSCKDLVSNITDFLNERKIPHEFVRFETSGETRQVSLLANFVSVESVEEFDTFFSAKDPEIQINISQSRNLS